MATILVFGESTGGRVAPITAELLGAATRMSAALGADVACALIGNDLDAAARGAVAAGADTVFVAGDPALGQYQTDHLPAGRGRHRCAGRAEHHPFRTDQPGP